MPPNTILIRSGGGLATSDALTTFFYLLLRDHLPFGSVESLLLELEKSPPYQEGCVLSNRSLGIYASDLAERIRALSPSPSGSGSAPGSGSGENI